MANKERILTQREAEIHKRNGGKTCLEWDCVDLSDETFPLQVEVATTCSRCKGSLLLHPVERTMKGVICWDCMTDNLREDRK